MPLRVLIGIVVLGLTVPTIVSGLSAFEAQQVTTDVARELEGLVRVAQQFHLAGGGAEDVRVDLSGGTMVRVEYAWFGDVDGGPRASAVGFRVRGQAEVFLLSDPPVPMVGPDGALRLPAGMHTIRVAYDGAGPVSLEAIP